MGFDSARYGAATTSSAASNKLRQWRAIATRYDKATRYRGALHLHATLI